MDYRTKFVKNITDQLTDLYPDADNISAVGAYIELIIPEELWETGNFLKDFYIAVDNMGLFTINDGIRFCRTLTNGTAQKYYVIKIGIPNKAGD